LFEQRAILVVQIKKKDGIDAEDVLGVDQLIRIRQEYPGASLALISTADDFTQRCKVLANEHGVQLISNQTLATMFLKYML
jgi:hypothetical protein